MVREPISICNSKRDFDQLMIANRRAVNEHNEKTLSALLLMGWVLVLLALVSVPFSNTKADAAPAYLLAFSAFFVLFLLYKIPIIKKHTFIGMYVSFSILFLLAIYLSIIHSPNMRATILLGGFVIMPLSIIDRPRKTMLFLLFWLAVHTVLAFYLKPLYALDDAINCLCAAVLGCYLGKKLVIVRLESFEAKRLLVIEKETDELTGLSNRRKLFEALAVDESTNTDKPSGIMMLDIDHFKDFNDNYGHTTGDRCLKRFSEVLIKFSQSYRIDFYRYGGEEFIAVAYGYSEKELFAIAENLRTTVQSIDMDGYRTTVSIGVAYCGEEHVQNYDNVIERADKAAYAAKRKGRNKVCTEHEIQA